MAIGSAATFAKVIGGAVALALAMAAPTAATEGDNPCQAPAATVAAAAPLPHLEKLLQAKKSIRVLAIGSSSTVGVGASSPRATYTSQLGLELGKTFKGLNVAMVNRGVSGEVAETTASRLRVEVALTKPDLVLWQVGTNDALSRVPISDFAQTVSRTLKWLKGAGVDVVLVGPQFTKGASKDEHYRLMKDALKQVAHEENVPLIKRYEAMQYLQEARAKLSLMSEDELHLNDLGYRCMAEHVARGILVSVFAKPGDIKPIAAPTQ